MNRGMSRATALALMATALVALQPSAASATSTGTIRLVRPAPPVWKGESARLAGRFRHAHRRVFVIEKARPGSSTWHRVKGTRARTTRRGRYHATVTPRRTLKYRAVLRATRSKPRRASRVIKVRVSKGWRRVSGGDAHTCGIRTDGSLWCWGSNYYGQLADQATAGTNDPAPSPTRVQAPGTDPTWRRVSSGYGHACGIRRDHTLWCWGYNKSGQLGTTASNTTENPNPTPTQVIAEGTDQTWLSVSAGGFHTCGIRTDHTVWCWGDNESGQLGDSTYDDTPVPHPVPAQVIADGTYQTWLSISAGELHTCGIRTDHTLWCWGENALGEIGYTDGSGMPVTTPTQVIADGADQTWLSVTAGALHTCGIRTDHTLWCWGANDYGQLGNETNAGTLTANPTPTQVLATGSDQTWLSAAAGWLLSCGIRADHTLWCWGDNQWGELGTSTGAGTNDLTTAPTQVLTAGDDQTWQSVANGSTHACALRFDRSLWCWGNNGAGQLGNPANSGTSNPNPTPLPVVR